jgi:hypothetical protein
LQHPNDLLIGSIVGQTSIPSSPVLRLACNPMTPVLDVADCAVQIKYDYFSIEHGYLLGFDVEEFAEDSFEFILEELLMLRF